MVQVDSQPQGENVCPQGGDTALSHHWVTVNTNRFEAARIGPDGTVRQTTIDPMVWCEVYVDTGDPVYPYPYSRPEGADITTCTNCGRTK